MLKFQEEHLKVANAQKDYAELADRVEELRKEKENILLTMAEEKNGQSRLKTRERYWKLFEIIEKIAKDEALDERYRDYSLDGNYKGTRECHIEPDFFDILKNRRCISIILSKNWLTFWFV